MPNRILFLLFSVWLTVPASSLFAQNVRFVKDVRLSGTVADVRRGVLDVTDESGKVWPLRFSVREDAAVQLSSNRLLKSPKTSFSIGGELQSQSLQKGVYVEFDNATDGKSKLLKQVDELRLVD